MECRGAAGLSTSQLEWVCTARRAWRAGRLTPYVHDYLRALVPSSRVTTNVWVRYRLEVKQLSSQSSSGVELFPVDRRLFEMLCTHRERDENQVRSALRFWRLGFGEGYLWMDNGEPLCLQWLIKPEHLPARDGLREWAGMYPPIGKNVGFVESIYTFRKGLRRPGGVATAMADAVLQEGRKQGLTEFRTQVHQDNVAAHRWAARIGWTRFGEVVQYSLDVRGLRRRYLYLHTREIAHAPDSETAMSQVDKSPAPLVNVLRNQ